MVLGGQVTAGAGMTQVLVPLYCMMVTVCATAISVGHVIVIGGGGLQVGTGMPGLPVGHFTSMLAEQLPSGRLYTDHE